MTTHHLLHHFAPITEAPAAVARLRQFVLDLAVRGKLVAQENENSSAFSIIDDTPFPIPAHWQWRKLKDIGETQTGSTPRTSEPECYGGTIPFIKPAAIKDSIVTYDGEGLTELGVKQSTCINAGTILMVCIGGSIGKAALVNRRACFNQQINSLSPYEGINSRFLLFAMQASYFQTQVTETAAQGTLPIISKGKWERLFVPLPPLAEQQRIVAKVDELMTLCDELAAAQSEREARRDRLVAATLHRLAASAADPTPFPARARFYFTHLPRLTTRPEHIHQLRQTILNLAVQGKLVPQDPHDEPAANLLAELRNAKDELQNEENIRDRKPVERLEKADLGYAIPDTWELPIFDDIFVMISGVTKGRNLAGRKTIELPYLRVANVQRGYLDLSVMKTILIPEDELLRYQLRIGDIVMTEGGDWDKLGRAAIWVNDLPECIHQNHIFRVRIPLLNRLLPRWVITYVNSELGRAYFEDASKQTTNLASINMTQLRGCPLPLPPLAEQQRIVARVDELLALCDELAANLDTVTATRRRLLEAALQETLVAASGERALHGSGDPASK